MRVIFLLIPLLVILLTGCSTGYYLKPEGLGGKYTSINPSCPGPKEVVEYDLNGENWIIFRAYAKTPSNNNSGDIKIYAYVSFIYARRESPVSMKTIMFPSELETKSHRKLVNSRLQKDFIVTASSSLATLQFPDGSSRQISLPFFEKPYNPSVEKSYYLSGPEVIIPETKFKEFTIIFPDIYLNDIRIHIPDITFKEGQDSYFPVLNC